MIRIAVFLGNPGEKYRRTRHNIARQFCDYYCDQKGISQETWKQKLGGLIAVYGDSSQKLLLFKAKGYMNTSGASVAEVCRFYRIDPGEVLVAHDELELDIGAVRHKTGGGLAGHNGLRSVAKFLGTESFQRLRIGIGRPPRGDTAAYVLSAFTKKEKDVLIDAFATAEDLVDRLTDC